MPRYQLVKMKMRDGAVLEETVVRLNLNDDLEYARTQSIAWTMRSMQDETEAMARDNYGLRFMVEEVTPV